MTATIQKAGLDTNYSSINGTEAWAGSQACPHLGPIHIPSEMDNVLH
jgi:hypothetical protein